MLSRVMAHVIKVEPYCVLCRETLLDGNGRNAQTPHNEEWESDVICCEFICLNTEPTTSVNLDSGNSSSITRSR